MTIRTREDGMIWACGGHNKKHPPINKWAASFGQILRARRQELELSMEALAKDGNVSKTYLSFLENGLRDPYRLTLRTIVRICNVYRIKPEAVLKRFLTRGEGLQ